MERKQSKVYRVLHLRDGRVFEFDRSEGVARHVLALDNFDLPNVNIYKSGHRWKFRLNGTMEVDQLALVLKDWKP